MYKFGLILLIVASGILSACGAKDSGKSDASMTLSATSGKNLFSVTMRPQQTPVMLNQMHSWEIQVKDSSGKPVSKAKIIVTGGMPQHNHGLPTQPAVTKEISPGHYLLEGVKFSMAGWWEFKVDVEAGKASDIATINTIINTEINQPASASAMATMGSK